MQQIVNPASVMMGGGKKYTHYITMCTWHWSTSQNWVDKELVAFCCYPTDEGEPFASAAEFLQKLRADGFIFSTTLKNGKNHYSGALFPCSGGKDYSPVGSLETVIGVSADEENQNEFSFFVTDENVKTLTFNASEMTEENDGSFTDIVLEN